MRPAVFLDRDDTLIRNADLPAAAWRGRTPGDLLDPAHVELLPGAGEACRRLVAGGFTLVVFTSQGGVARGGGTIRDIERVNDAVRTLLADGAGPGFTRSIIAAFYAVPFHPEGTVARFAREHVWRKPGAGMLLAARDELEIDLSRSWAVGDMARDAEAAAAAGIDHGRCLLLGRDAADLAGAASRILGA